MSKISELSDGGSLVSSDYLIAVRSGGNVKVRMDQINVDQIDLGDNEFIRLGNSQDLTIVHAATQSIINQAGIGDLLIQKAGSTKLTVNSSGIDVTGTVTADGLTVNSGAGDLTASFQSTDQFADLKLTDSGGSSYIRQSNGSLLLQADRDNASSNSIVQVSVDGVQTARFSSGGDISFYEDTGTTAKLFWDASAESLGIGTSSPFFTAAGRSSLSVNGTSSSILAFGKGGSSENYILADAGGLTIANTSATLPTAFFNNGSTRMTISSAGSVGIGVTPKTTNATVTGSLNVNQAGLLVRNSNQAYFASNIYWDASDQLKSHGAGYGLASLFIPSDGSHRFFNTTAAATGADENLTLNETMRIDASNRLLVGKTASDYAVEGVEIRSNEVLITKSTTNPLNVRNGQDGGLIAFASGSNTVGSIGTEGGDLTIGSSASGHKGVRFGANYIAPINTSNAFEDNTTDLGLPAVRFKDLYMSGIIAKGTGGELDLRSDGGGFNYKQNLDVATAGVTFTGQSTRGDMAAIRLYQTATGADGGYIRFDTCNSGSTTLTEKARLDSSGNLLVGQTSGVGIGGTPADVNGAEIGKGYINLNRDDTADARQIQFGKNGSVVGHITTDGSATSYNTSSDYRLKENIVDAPSASDDIDAIQVRSFDWKSDGSHQKYGMVAQELQTVAPEAVSGDPESEEMMGVDYSKLVPMMLKEIQSLRARVAQLES